MGGISRKMACEFLINGDSPPSRVQSGTSTSTDEQPPPAGSARRATIPRLPQNKFRRGGSPVLQVVEQKVGHP